MDQVLPLIQAVISLVYELASVQYSSKNGEFLNRTFKIYYSTL
jgi:hypothetical protein